MLHPLVQPGRRGLREAGANGGGTGAEDSGGAEEDEDAEVHGTKHCLVVEMGNIQWLRHAGRADEESEGVVLEEGD